MTCVKWSDFVQQNCSVNKFSSSESWIILSSIEAGIKEKIETIGTPLKDWNIQINYGIKTGCNEAFIVDSATREQILANCTSDEERCRTAELIRPILRGRDIKRYGYDFADKYLVATFPSRGYCIDEYPAVKKYLLSFAENELRENGYDWIADDSELLSSFCQQKIDQTGKPIIINGRTVSYSGVQQKARKKTSNKWFETQDSISYWDDFNKPKAMWKIIGCNINFAFDDSKMMCNNAVDIITGDRNTLLQFVGLMNSKLFDWYLKLTTEAEVQGGGIQLYVTTLEKTLLKLDFDNGLSSIVEKRVNGEIDDEAVDQFVFDSYKLTAEEINCVLCSSKVNR